MIILIIYLIGSILSYGACYAFFCNMDYICIKWWNPNPEESTCLMCSLFSWFSFIIFLQMNCGDKYLIKYNNKDLWKLRCELKEKSIVNEE